MLEKNRTIYYDIIRIIAIFFVVFNHTNENGYLYFITLDKGISYWICMMLSVVCKAGVPLFFMVSGALLLGKQEDIATVYKKRISRYVVVIIVFSFLQYLIELEFSIDKINLLGFIKRIYSENIVTPYWFLYAYVSFLIMLPLLRKLVCGLKENDYKYIFIIYVMFKGLIPIAEYLVFEGEVRICSQINFPIIVSQTIFYPLMGYYFDKVKTNYSKRAIGIWWPCCIVAVIITCLMTQYRINITGQIDGSSLEYFFSILIEFPAVALFISSKYLCERIRIASFVEKIIMSFGGATFGIYLFERIFRRSLFFVFLDMKDIINTFLANFIYVLLVLGCGWLITFVLKKLPGIRKLI